MSRRCVQGAVTSVLVAGVLMGADPLAVSTAEARRLAPTAGPHQEYVVRGRITVPTGVLAGPLNIYLQDGAGGIAVAGNALEPLMEGEETEVTGKLYLDEGIEPVLAATRIRKVGSIRQFVKAREITREEAASGKYAGELVKARGLVTSVSAGGVRDYILIGSDPKVRVKLVQVSAPPPLTVRQIAAGAGFLVLVGAAVALWIITLRRSVARHTQQIRNLLEKANEASRLKSEFLANVSHEIRTPMNGILGMTDLALGTKLAADQREYLEAIRTSADALLRVINDVLDFSKIEAGRLDLQVSEFEPREMLGNVLRAMAVHAEQKGLELVADLAPGLPRRLRGDAVRLRQVLINLLGNAIKFTERGDVTLRASASLAGEGCELRFAVADTGIGIHEDKLEKIFSPFAQADGSITRRFGGTGLGLSISNRLVALMGGRIWAHSQIGKGSTFQFTVPMEVVDADLCSATGASAGEGVLAPGTQVGDLTQVAGPNTAPKGLRILLAEDNLVNQRVASGILVRRGHVVEIANNGREALSALDRGDFDVILMDVQMPVMGGFEATAAIRAREAMWGRRVPIVALTAHAMKGDRERCLEAGMDDHITKPFNVDELEAVLERAVAGSKCGK